MNAVGTREIGIKPLKGEHRKDGSPKTAADKRAEALARSWREKENAMRIGSSRKLKRSAKITNDLIAASVLFP
jgi:hypothetical protein